MKDQRTVGLLVHGGEGCEGPESSSMSRRPGTAEASLIWQAGT